MLNENVHRIEVGIHSNWNVLTDIKKFLHIQDISQVQTIEVFTIEGGNLTVDQLDFLGKEVFSDPIIDKYSINTPLMTPFQGILVEIGFKPGVTDNVGRTAVSAIKDALKIDVSAVYSSIQYLLYDITKIEAEIIAKELLANNLIERWEILDGKEYLGIKASIPKVILSKKPIVNHFNLNISDHELLTLSKTQVLALNLEEMKTLQSYYKSIAEERKSLNLPIHPTDVELECLAQTWSEHCCHKIFNAKIEYQEPNKTEIIDSVFKTYIRAATEKINSEYLVSVFKDNAGVIKFTDDYTFAMKVETHNSPTALDPYGGALTGIVGCNRDPAGTGKGFKLIFNTDVFCFASPFYEGKVPPRLFHPRRVLKGVHKGVIDGGNQSGIPTVNGSLYFDDRYLGKPLVFVGTGGIAPAKIDGIPTHEKAPQVGDLIIMVGGRIGADGIHGATFSSMEINENSPATAVQIGSPIVQKNMLDFLLVARDQKLFTAITDNGAGGLSSSIGEMGEEIGARIDLDKAPLKYPGLMPWEILVSEAQERMTIAVPPENIEKFMALSLRFDVESTVIGEFTDSKHLEVCYENKLIGYIAMDFLHNGVPQKHMIGKWKPTPVLTPEFPEPENYGQLIQKMLGRLNICSMEESIVRSYDHEVQGASIIKPYMGLANDGPSDAAVIKPLFDTWEGLAISHGMCPRYSDIDTYHMVANAIDEAVRNAICVGANPEYMAGLDNFCWAMGFSQADQEKYTADLVRANKALYDYTITFKVPCISGKDSMYNDYRIGDTKVSVPPTLLFSLAGKLPDVRKAVSMDVKSAGDLVFILGETKDELGASEYCEEIGIKNTLIPKVDAKSASDRYQRVYKSIQGGVIKSCHDCSTGGVGVALAECAFAGGIGMEIDLSKIPHHFEKYPVRDDILLFSESASRLIITISPENKSKLLEIFDSSIIAEIGVVKGNSFQVKGINQNFIIDDSLEDLKKSWQQTMKPLEEQGGGE
jgi:phosphoribosylformylglycinamidine synthase